MPKTKNYKRVIKYNANNANNSNNVSENHSNYIKPSFPSTLTVNDLIKNTNTNNNKPKTLPNAFIAYRMALIKEYRIKNYKLPPMGKVSKIAKNSWNMEPDHIKKFYESLVKEAKSIYKQNSIQIVLDKHMNQLSHVKNNQQIGGAESAERENSSEDANEHLRIQDTTVNYSVAEMNLILFERIRALEQNNRELEQSNNRLSEQNRISEQMFNTLFNNYLSF